MRAQVRLPAAERLGLRPADIDALTVAEFDAMVAWQSPRTTPVVHWSAPSRCSRNDSSCQLSGVPPMPVKNERPPS